MSASALFDVAGLSVVVTGAASGIGLGYAEALAANGARVTMIDMNAAQLEAAVKKLRDAGAQVFGAVADVTQIETLQAAIDATIEREKRIDVVFSNAGISAGPGFLTGDGSRNPAAAFENLSPELMDRAVATNLGGAFRTIKVVVPQMKRQGSGRIIVTTTVAVHTVETLVSTLYVASKAGLLQLVRQAALELARYGILVNGIAPGPAITNIGGGRLQDASARAPFERANPMHRLATPQDIQGAALFFASAASNFITGTQIVIDGGGSLGRAD
jgi:NAD(P)-dependent dehydrogenase (short-subunit alcohol dehydrogenase family)